MIDFNGEYVDCANQTYHRGPKYKNTFCLSTRDADGDRFPDTTETLSEPDFWVVFLEATEKTQMPFLRRSVENNFLLRKSRMKTDFKGLIGRLIFAATTEGDRDLEKAVVINLLSEVRDCPK